jgi:hypothetical protein
MNKGIFMLAISIALLFLFTGCFEEEQNNKMNPVPEEPIGYWQNTTDYRWISNGTCCGEKEQIKEEYILEEKVNNTRWTDTGRTRANTSMLPPDTWYTTGEGNIYTREEEFRKYICLGGNCAYSVTDTRWYQTGVMVMENINKSKDISINRGNEEEWYIVVEPTGDETADITFRILAQGYDDLPVFMSHDMKTAYHSGKAKLPERYTMSININSGEINVYVLDYLAYEELF